MGFERNFQIRTSSKNILKNFSSGPLKRSALKLGTLRRGSRFYYEKVLENYNKTLFQIRVYSTKSSQSFEDKSLLGRTTAIQPGFITGFIDAEGCFYVSITKNNKLNVGCRM